MSFERRIVVVLEAINYFLPLIVSSYEPDVDVILDRRDLKGEEDEDDDEAEFLVREDPASVYLPRSSLDLSDESNEHGMITATFNLFYSAFLP